MQMEIGATYARKTGRAMTRLSKNGLRLLSEYKLPDGRRIWIITEWDRSATTLLFPEDY